MVGRDLWRINGDTTVNSLFSVISAIYDDRSKVPVFFSSLFADPISVLRVLLREMTDALHFCWFIPRSNDDARFRWFYDTVAEIQRRSARRFSFFGTPSRMP